MMKRKFVLVRRGPRKYRKPVRGSRMFSPEVRSFARRHRLLPDRALLRGGYGTWRRGGVYLVVGSGSPKIRRRMK